MIEDDLGDVYLTEEALKDAKVRNNLNVVGAGVEAMALLRKEGKNDDANRSPTL